MLCIEHADWENCTAADADPSADALQISSNPMPRLLAKPVVFSPRLNRQANGGCIVPDHQIQGGGSHAQSSLSQLRKSTADKLLASST